MGERKMNAKQALDLLYSAARMARMPAEAHDQATQAAKILQAAIQEPPDDTSKTDEED